MSTAPETRFNADPVEFGKWIADLRSGEFQKGVDCLARVVNSDTREYCCLGVRAARVTPQEEVLVTNEDNRVSFAGYRTLPRPGVLTSLFVDDRPGEEALSDDDDDVIAFAPDEERPATANLDPGVVYVSFLNDVAQWSFDRIADRLEERFLPASWERTKASRAK